LVSAQPVLTMLHLLKLACADLKLATLATMANRMSFLANLFNLRGRI